MALNDGGNPAILLRLPEQIGKPLIRAAKKSKRTVQAEILAILATHYGVEIDAPQRGRPAKPTE